MVNIDALKSSDELVSAGTRALARGAWMEGRDFFQRAVDLGETPAALEGLATAAWWLDDAPVVFRSREHAYRLYRQHGDRLGAARTATGLGLDHYLYRGDLAIASGWLQRAHRLLDGTEPSAERGWLAMWEAHIALLEHNDVALAKRACAETLALAESLDLSDLETLCLALEGLALVSEGHVNEGMRRLDEATTAALAGEMSDLDAVVTTYCYLIYACERVRDYERAVQWCEKVEEVSRRGSYRAMFGVCRCHYAAVLIWQGDWLRAEAELTMATRELMSTRPGWVFDSIVRLAEIRRRQGRLNEAATLFGQASAHPHALLGLAELALDRGEATTATDLLDRYLRRVPSDDRTERAGGHALAARAWVALGDVAKAETVVTELEAIVKVVGTEPLHAIACFARGFVASAAGDLGAARRCFEDAVDLFEKNGAPFETAQARIELARVQLASDRRRAATAEASVARDIFERLGATQELRRGAPLFAELGISLAGAGDKTPVPAGLTQRETQVLRLVARGLSNHQIAGELFISVRTVERHVSTIYGKIGAEGTSARSIATVYAFECGLARVVEA